MYEFRLRIVSNLAKNNALISGRGETTSPRVKISIPHTFMTAEIVTESENMENINQRQNAFGGRFCIQQVISLFVYVSKNCLNKPITTLSFCDILKQKRANGGFYYRFRSVVRWLRT